MWTPSSSIVLIGNLSINWYGVLMALGVLLGLLLSSRLAKRDYGISFDTMTDLCLVVVPLALIGARLYYVALSWEQYAYEPVRILYIWEGGLALYGATLGGLIALAIVSRWKKIRFLKLTDCVAPAMALGQAIGRWGNFFNQEAFGNRIDDAAWQWFPNAVWIENPFGTGVSGWYQATFFYESLACFLIVGILLLYARHAKKRQVGDVMFLYMLLYGIERAFVEGLRTDSLFLGGIRASQWLSIVFVIVSLAGLVALHILKKERVRAGDGLTLPAAAGAGKDGDAEGGPEQGGEEAEPHEEAGAEREAEAADDPPAEADRASSLESAEAAETPERSASGTAEDPED